MSSEKGTPKDWFDWAGTCLADWKLRDAKWHDSFSPSAEQVLKLATQAALSLGHDAVGAEHLLAAVLRFNSGHASAALKPTGLTLPALRQEIESAWGVTEKNIVKRRIPYTPRCRGIIERAQANVRSLDDGRVEIEDLLLELLAEENGLPAQIFRRRDVDVEAIKKAVITKAVDQ
jgi:ATP-dependent Clp protease ATP-binding subunit ClpC